MNAKRISILFCVSENLIIKVINFITIAGKMMFSTTHHQGHNETVTAEWTGLCSRLWVVLGERREGSATQTHEITYNSKI